MMLLDEYDLPVFFVTPDVNYALGYVGVVKNLHIITLHVDPLLPYYDREVAFLCLEQEGVLDYPNTAGHILEHEITQRYIAEHAEGQQPRILYFKPSPKLDKVIADRGYWQIGIGSELNRRLEDKLELGLWADKWMPSFEIGVYDELDYGRLKQQLGEVLVVQTARGWAGQSTWLVRNFKQWQALELGRRQVRVSCYLSGQVLTVNGVILDDQLLWGQIGRQVNPPDDRFSINPMATVGRIWEHDAKNEGIYEWLEPIGRQLQQQGHRGWFGLDVIRSDGQYYLIEVNPRMTASTSFYSRLELIDGSLPLTAYHLMSFEREAIDLPVYTRADSLQGSQLLLRYHGSAIMENSGLEPRIWKAGAWLPFEIQLKVDQIAVIWTAKPDVSEGSELVRFESLDVLVSAEGRLVDSLSLLLSQTN